MSKYLGLTNGTAMRNAILTMLLFAVSNSAVAEWVEVARLTAGRVYADAATIRREGNLVRIETLYALNKPVISETNGKPYASQKVQNEFDCKQKLWRMLEYSWYTGTMGDGQMVENFSESYKLRTIPSGGAVEMLWKHACSQ